ncbi:hypothetical protein CFP65_3118 [Kitasatospora sp. MMS16-BH015]|uniref:PE-PGRS family protein n=1 Tax=Kitasatospora sp. MMS16-BH015 TaxID=2018025 RepID=UPI000CA2FD57|nr:PE-PGRS family protein [Kitasatospora sp. MMS16-BH015]AUG77925.1 hypothetical protein CFP65_3118 [Kitasatospora sp. MMS16-BH015]
MESGRVVRVGRAAVFAAACVLLAAFGHVLMSGVPVPGWALAAAFGGTGVIAWLTARRERGPLLVTGLTVGIQAALHAVFSLGQAGSAAPDSGGLATRWAQLLLCNAGPLTEEQAASLAAAAGLDPARPPGSGLSVVPVDLSAGLPDASVMADMPRMAMAGTVLPHHAMAMVGHQHAGGMSGMLVAHLLAALLLGLWLAAGERAVHRLAGTVAAWLFAPVLLLLGTVGPVGPPRLRRSGTTTRRPRSRLLVHTLTTRGPPVRTAVL